jgi:hypothetical protein
MSLEKQVSSEKLGNDASYGPYVGEFVPLAAFQYDFRRSILARAYD